MTSPDKDAQRTLEQFWEMAQSICATVAVFQPDLAIGLAHGGFPLLYAAQVAWREACRTPFPPMLRLNIGWEKRDRMARGHTPYVEWPEEAGTDAAVLAWTARQSDWQAELAGLVAGVLGPNRTPERILAVDDFYFEGITWLQTVGLLEATFPGVDARFMVTQMEWRPPLMKELLRRHHPEVYEYLATPSSQDERRTLDDSYSMDLRWLATGSEDDLGPDSLAWRRISPDSPTMSRLTALLPSEELMRAPTWIYATIAAYVRRRAGEEAWSPLAAHGEPGEVNAGLTIAPVQRIIRHLLLHRRIARRDVVATCRLSRNQAHRLLRKLARRREIKKRGKGQATHYVRTSAQERDGQRRGAS